MILHKRISNAVVIFACMLSLGAASAYAKSPNIIFIFSDDHTWQTISAYGHPLSKVVPTPNIDRIGAKGIRFDRCLVTNSICKPSRATVLTGKYSHLNGQLNNGGTFNGDQMTFPKDGPSIMAASRPWAGPVCVQEMGTPSGDNLRSFYKTFLLWGE